MCCLLKSWLLMGIYTTILPHPFMDTTIFPVPYTARFLPTEKGSEYERYYLILNAGKICKIIRLSKSALGPAIAAEFYFDIS